MAKRLAAIIFIFICTTIAWMILGGTITARTENFGPSLRDRVATTWGVPQVQVPPTAEYQQQVERTNEKEVNGRKVVEKFKVVEATALPIQASQINVGIDLEHRQKGLLWYATYKVNYAADYTFQNDSDSPQLVSMTFKFPTEKAVYDDFQVLANGEKVKVENAPGTAIATASVPAKTPVVFHVAYRSQGLDRWIYHFGDQVSQVRNFSLQMSTNFSDIDFDNTLSPSDKRPSGNGWLLTWKYSNLLSGYDIGMVMPEKLQPGPLAGQISFFAPVSLFFFFFLMIIITTLRDIDLHPMNYFFLATAFFSFHLLMAYLVDHMSIHLAFVICSIVSVFLVVSYLRLVVGMRFAAVEAGISQFIYLVLFSYAFFFKGFTGLAVTIGSIVTLFVVMQMTGRIRWADKFAKVSLPRMPRTNPANGTSMLD